MSFSDSLDCGLDVRNFVEVIFLIKFLNEPINDLFYDLISSSTTKIRLCAPYVKNEIIQCDSNNTGKITPKNIQDIRNILNHLPAYNETNFDLYSPVDEVDSILEIDKELILSKLSAWKKAMF